MFKKERMKEKCSDPKRPRASPLQGPQSWALWPLQEPGRCWECLPFWLHDISQSCRSPSQTTDCQPLPRSDGRVKAAWWSLLSCALRAHP